MMKRDLKPKRQCAYPECKTKISDYNPEGSFCSIHERYEYQLLVSESGEPVTKRQVGLAKNMRVIPFDELAQFSWPVYRYDIEKNPKNPSESFICLAQPTKKKDLSRRWYEPLKDRSLPLKLAKVKEHHEANILRFVNEYGCLQANGPEALSFFQGEVRVIRDLVNLYQAVQDGDKALRDIIKITPGKGPGLLLPEDYLKVETKLPTIPVYFLEKSQLKGKNQLTKTAKAILSDTIINGMKLHGVYQSVRLTKEGNLEPIYAFSGLIGAIYFQLYTVVTQRWKYKRCAELKKCGNLFIPQRSDNNFCSARCRSRYYTRQSRKSN